MQSKTSRGVRHVLVAAGVVSLVLSAAAPAALAADSGQPSGNPHADNTELGTTRVLVCHNGRVLEVDDDGGDLGGHRKHGDAVWLDASTVPSAWMLSCSSPADVVPADDGDHLEEGGELEEGEELEEGDELESIQVCRAGELVTIDLAELGAAEIGITRSTAGMEPSCDARDDTTGGDEDDEKTGDDESGDTTDPKDGPDAPTGPGDVAGSVDELPAGGPGDPAPIPSPAPIISTITVTRPVEATAPNPTPAVPAAPAPVSAPVAPAPAPAAPTPAPAAAGPAAARTDISSTQENAVLGSVTTRIPSVGAGAGVAVLAATGFDLTAALAVLGGLLLLGGLVLMVLGRTRVRHTA